MLFFIGWNIVHFENLQWYIYLIPTWFISTLLLLVHIQLILIHNIFNNISELHSHLIPFSFNLSVNVWKESFIQYSSTIVDKLLNSVKSTSTKTNILNCATSPSSTVFLEPVVSETVNSKTSHCHQSGFRLRKSWSVTLYDPIGNSMLQYKVNHLLL